MKSKEFLVRTSRPQAKEFPVRSVQHGKEMPLEISPVYGSDSFWIGTFSEYEALPRKNATTCYLFIQ